MKNFSKLLIVFVVLLFFSGIGFIFTKNAFDTQKWLVYENSRYGFSIDFPPGWTLGEQEVNNTGREIYSPSKEITCYVYGFENALITEDGDPQSLEEFVEWLSDNRPFISRSSTKLSGITATDIVLENEDNSLMRAVYTMLDDASGRGFRCLYKNRDIIKSHNNDFNKMVESFDIKGNKQKSSYNMSTACKTLLSEAIIPLKDSKSFIDKNYTEVTTTSRKSWNKNKLPDQVIDLENAAYTCYPMPYDIAQEGEVIGMHVEPAVLSVEWTCELEHTNYKYLELDAKQEVSALSSKGYSCEKELCMDVLDKESAVWLCSK